VEQRGGGVHLLERVGGDQGGVCDGDQTGGQGLTLVHFLAQNKHFLWDVLGGFQQQERLRLS